MSIFGRLSTAMVTPFDAKGNIDFQKTSHLVEYSQVQPVNHRL